MGCAQDIVSVPCPRLLAAELLNTLHQDVDTFGCLQDIEHKLASGLSCVRSTINNHRPIHQVPVEVLGLIFCHALPSQDGGFRDSGSKDPDFPAEVRTRLAIPQVCRRWRAVACNLAAFWTVINVSAGMQTAPWFDRSGTMPLHVFARYPLDSTTESPFGLHSERIRSFFLAIPPEHRTAVPTELPAFLPAARELECLVIATRCRTFDEGRPMVDLARPVPLFPAPLPRLRMLILKNPCWVPAVSYGTLTHLHISQGTPLDLGALLDLLARCASLEKLVFADVYLAGSRNVFATRTVSLPRLRLLVLGIHNSRLWMRMLLRTLVLPPAVAVRIGGAEAVRALSDLRPFPHLPFTDDFDALAVDHSARAGLVIRASGPAGSRLLLDLGPGYVSMLGSLKTIVLPALVPFARIRHLEVCADRVDVALQPLPDMPALERLALVDRAEPTGADRVAAALKEAAARAPDVAELELWTPRYELECVHQLPHTLAHLRRFVLVHTSPGAAPAAPPGVEHLRDWIRHVEFRAADAPGMGPPQDLYAW
ncbi:hypothetical protein BD413DRAFT_476605 [Trametes elegans]|nr:hypothetical protein BD413DRAFT_476605 [Trametes elegans]